MLRERLLETVPEASDGDAATGGDLDVQLRLGEEGQPVLVSVAGAPQWEITKLEDAFLEEITRNLARVADRGRGAGASRNIIRRKGEPDAYDQPGAASRLKVAPEWLKSVIPCSNYSYDEIDGRKIIREYFWNVELIENLFRLKNSKITPEDLKYVADQCCFGDVDWARDLIARLKSPNRPEPAPKAAPAKVQPKQNRPMHRERPPRHRAKKPA